MKKYQLVFITIATFLILLYGCKTADTSVDGSPALFPPESREKMPEWVTRTPSGTSQYEYFVGVGTDDTGDSSKAQEKAVLSLVGEVTRFLGVRITAETTMETRDTLETYQAEITEKIKQTAFARIGDFRIKEKWIERKNGQVTVYLLGEYDREALQNEKARLEALLAERAESVSLPEKEGDALREQGKLYQSAIKYLEAASAAATGSTDLDNAEVKFIRNINKAKEVLGKINLFTLNNNLETFVKRSFPEPFRLKVVAGNSPQSPGLSGVNIRVTYKKVRSSGQPGIESVTLYSGEEGILSFNPPPPGFVGEDAVYMTLQLGSYLEALENVPEGWRKHVEGLEQLMTGKRVVFNYFVLSRAREVPTGVFTVDVGRAGNPRESMDSAAGVMEVLTDAGFSITLLSEHFSLIQKSDSEIIKHFQSNYGNRIERLAYGVTRISEFEELDGGYIVKVEGTVKVAELSSGNILYSGNKLKRTRGSNLLSTISAAFKALGRDFGKEMAVKLP